MLLTATYVAVSFVVGENALQSRITIAIIQNDEDELTDLAIRYISSMDSVKSISKFVKMTKEGAMYSLEKGNVAAVLEIPPDFYNAVNEGINPHIGVYITKNNSPIAGAFLSLIESAIKDIGVGEATVYAFLEADIVHIRSAEFDKEALGDYIAGIYAKIFMRKAGIFNDLVVSSFGEYNTAEYYLCTLLLVVMLFCAGGFSYLYRKSYNAVYEQLKRFGISGTAEMAVNIVIVTVFVYVTALAVYILAILSISIILEINISFMPFMPVVMFIVSLAVSVIANLFFKLTGSHGYSKMAAFCILTVLLIISGSLVPSEDIPQWCDRINLINPVKYCMSVLLKGIGG